MAPYSVFINWVVRALTADWLTAVVYTKGMTKYMYFYCSNYVDYVEPVYNSNMAPLGFVVYGQYTTAKGSAMLCA